MLGTRRSVATMLARIKRRAAHSGGSLFVQSGCARDRGRRYHECAALLRKPARKTTPVSRGRPCGVRRSPTRAGGRPIGGRCSGRRSPNRRNCSRRAAASSQIRAAGSARDVVLANSLVQANRSFSELKRWCSPHSQRVVDAQPLVPRSKSLLTGRHTAGGVAGGGPDATNETQRGRHRACSPPRRNIGAMTAAFPGAAFYWHCPGRPFLVQLRGRTPLSSSRCHSVGFVAARLEKIRYDFHMQIEP